jgi:hypothetical protein
MKFGAFASPILLFGFSRRAIAHGKQPSASKTNEAWQGSRRTRKCEGFADICTLTRQQKLLLAGSVCCALEEDVKVGFVRADKTIAEVEAADRIPFQIFQTHRPLPFIGDRQRMSEDPRP